MESLALFLVLSIWVIMITVSKEDTILNNKYNSYFIIVSLFVFVSYKLITVENTSRDMARYLREFNYFSNISLKDAFIYSDKENLFLLFQWSFSQLFSHYIFYYLIIWFLFFVVFLKALKKIYSPTQLLFVFFSYLTYFLFFNYITNTIRQGIAISFLFLALSTLVTQKKNTVTFYLSIISAPLFHSSSLPLSLFLFIAKKFNFVLRAKTKNYIFLWLFMVVLFITNFNENIASYIESFVPQIDSYEATHLYNGTRIDFLLFGSFWVAFGLFMLKTKMKNNVLYERIFKIYIVFNMYFLFFGFLSFSDRTAAYSWFLVPLLITTPIFSSKRYKPLLLISCLLVFFALSFYNNSILFR